MTEYVSPREYQRNQTNDIYQTELALFSSNSTTNNGYGIQEKNQLETT